MRPALTRAELLAPSVIARPDFELRSVTVTRALALRLVALVSRPDTVRRAPGATAACGGELTDRSFADGVAAWA